MYDALVGIGSSYIYYIMLTFLALFPVVISGLAVNSSREFYLSRNLKSMRGLNPQENDLIKAREVWKLISIVIPAHNEESNLQKTINAALNIDWPELEVIIVNDGSIDKTKEIIELYINDPRIVYIDNKTNKGKAFSLNEGIAFAKSEVVLILDADAVPCGNVLNKMAPRLMLHENVAAVTGNPRVSSVPNLLTKLQAIEFTSTISTLRRGQTAWGRINTVSGIMTLFKKKIVTSAGGFSDTQPTEDIELTWKLHRLGYRCVYEPDAQVGMVVPSSLSSWFIQRTRWSSGLVRVLQKHGKNILKEKKWQMLPLLLEASLAIIWCHLLIAMTGLWVIGLLYGLPFLGNSLILSQWGIVTLSIALLQILWGMHLDSKNDKNILKLWILAPVYPLAYWWLSAFCVVRTTIPTLLRKKKVIKWETPRSKALT